MDGAKVTRAAHGCFRPSNIRITNSLFPKTFSQISINHLIVVVSSHAAMFWLLRNNTARRPLVLDFCLYFR